MRRFAELVSAALHRVYQDVPQVRVVVHGRVRDISTISIESDMQILRLRTGKNLVREN